MAAYEFGQMMRENQRILKETKILIDKELFDPTHQYNYRVKSISFENINGKVEIEGMITLPKDSSNIPDIVKTNKYSVRFDSKFLENNSNKIMFQPITLRVYFNFVTYESDIHQDERFVDYLNKIGNSCHFEYPNRHLYIVVNNLVNIDLRRFMKGKYPNDDNFDLQNKSFQSAAGFVINAEFKDDSHYYNKKIYKDEHGNHKYVEEQESLFSTDNFNRFPDNQIIQENELPMKNLIPTSNFIDFESNPKSFDFSQENLDTLTFREKQTLIDPFCIKKENLKKLRKGFYNNSFKPCFNFKGELITRGSFNNSTFTQNIVICKITPNKDLQTNELNTKNQFLDLYYKNTLVNYLGVLNQKISEKNKISQAADQSLDLDETKKNETYYRHQTCLNVNDYTFIINDYINDLTRAREHLKTVRNQNIKLFAENLDDTFEKEVCVLKLFRVLFLNSYLDKNSRGKENKQAEVESSREETRRMRKRRLVEWLIENTETEFQKEYEKLSKQVKNEKEKAYSLILHCLINGRIRKAVEISNKNNLFTLSMIISQTNSEFIQDSRTKMELKSKLIKESIDNWKRANLYNAMPEELKNIYNLLSNNFYKDNNRNEFNIDSLKDLLKTCDWKRILIVISCFTTSPSSKISQIYEQFEKIANLALSNNSYSNVLPETENKNTLPALKIKNIYYLLISLYSILEQTNNEGSKDLLDNCLNKLCYTFNLTSKFTDHHIHFIIINTLLNTLNESYYIMGLRRNEPQIINCLMKLQSLNFKILVKNVEELLISENTFREIKTSWKFAISLIKYSGIPKTMQKNLVDQMLYQQVENGKNDMGVYFNNKIFDERITKEALAIYNYSNFQFEEAYKNFKKAKNYEKAYEIFIFKILCPKLIQNDISNKITKKLKKLSGEKKLPSHPEAKDNLEDRALISYWEKYGSIFFEYLVLLDKEEIDAKSLLSTMDKVEALNINNEITNEKTITYCRNIMLMNLRKVYNKLCESKSNYDVNKFFILGSSYSNSKD